MEPVGLPGSTGRGNTISRPNRERVTASKLWCFTWNNYPEGWEATLATVLQQEKWIGTPEVGDSGTPHIQGYVRFHKKVRPMGYNGMPKEIHWEKCRGNEMQNIEYCTKTGAVSAGTLKAPRKMVFPEMDRPYQKLLLEVLADEPSNRKIYWFYGPGNIGKTTFCKYLSHEHGAILLQGKGHDVRNAVLTYYNDMKRFPEICLFNVPRCYEKEYVSYEALENVKDMYFYSGKYEGGMVNGPSPHLVVFSNDMPCVGKMSTDRWKIYKILDDFNVQEERINVELDSDGYSSGGHLYADAWSDWDE